MTSLDRRAFIAISAAALPLPLLNSKAAGQQEPANATAGASRTGKAPMAIGSANALPSVSVAVEMMKGSADPLDAIIDGINIVENDPNDMSVGLGGLPNENGVVELDASCMHGPSHKAGAVAGLQNIKNPSSVALQVLRRTDHVLLVGEGALTFARQLGFKEENLLTEKSREAWLKWKAGLNADDDWLNEDQQIPQGNIERMQSRARELGAPFTTGTIHVSAMNANNDLSACTSTSGLSWKLPGRVGDSPIIGAGMFCDNAVGSAGATGRGEAVIHACGAFQIVQHMSRGDDPTEACLKVLRYIAEHTHQKYLINAKGQPNFNVTLYALRKDGAYGSACLHKGMKFAVHDGASARVESCTVLFDD